MLSIYFDDHTFSLDEVVINPKHYFDTVREPDWFNDDFVKRMIKEIDGCDAVKDEFIISGYTGRAITPLHLSGGVKTLICIYKIPDKFWYAGSMGDNCCELLAEIARTKDVKIMLRHFMDFPDSCEDVLYLRGKKASIEDYENAFCDYNELIRKEQEDIIYGRC